MKDNKLRVLLGFLRQRLISLQPERCSPHDYTFLSIAVHPL